MRVQHLGMLILGICLIVAGILPFLGFMSPAMTWTLATLAIGTGLAVLYQRYQLSGWF